MKPILKLIAITFFLSFVIESTAQVHYAIRAGVSFPNLNISDDSGEDFGDFKTKVGFHVGATVDIPLSKLLSIETGLLFSRKGTQVEETDSFLGSTITFKTEVITSYIDLPISLKVNIPVGTPIIFISFGPYIGYGLSGKATTEFTVNGQTEKDEDIIDWGSDPDADFLKRFDFGIVPAAGIEFKSFSLSFSYWLGLTNISAYTEDGASIKNQNMQISLGYIFGKNRASK